MVRAPRIRPGVSGVGLCACVSRLCCGVWWSRLFSILLPNGAPATPSKTTKRPFITRTNTHNNDKATLPYQRPASIEGATSSGGEEKSISPEASVPWLSPPSERESSGDASTVAGSNSLKGRLSSAGRAVKSGGSAGTVGMLVLCAGATACSGPFPAEMAFWRASTSALRTPSCFAGFGRGMA